MGSKLFPERTDMRERVIMDCENWLMLTETDWLHVMALTLCFFHVSTCTMSPCISCMPYAVRYSLLALPKRLELVPRHGRKGGRFSPVVLCGRLVSVSCFHSLYYFFLQAAMDRQSFYLVEPLVNNSFLWCCLSGWPVAWPC